MIFSCYIFSLYYIAEKKVKMNNIYLYSIVTTSFLVVFLSATRSWIMTYIFVLILYFIFILKRIPRIFSHILIVFLFILIAYFSIPKFQVSTRSTFKRVFTIESLLKGDVTAGGTLTRIDVRLPKALEGIKKKPIFGWFASPDNYKYSQGGHVGNFDLLVSMGIVGFLLVLNFWVKFFKMISSTRKKLSFNNPYKDSIFVFNIALLGMALLHFTSYAILGWGSNQYTCYFFIFFIVFADLMVKESISEERNIENVIQKQN